MKNRTQNTLRTCFILSWALMALPLAAAPSDLLTFNGTFTHDDAPYDGTATATFTLYDDSTSSDAANVLWTEVHDLVVEDGEFEVVLGESTTLPADLGNHPELFLGVQVDSDDEMLPRLEMTAVPYAFGAHTAVTAESAESAANVGSHTTESLDALENTVTGLNS